MTARSTIVLGVLLIAGTSPATNGLDASPLVQPHRTDRDLRDAAWLHRAVTVEPDQIFEH
jgi:hypothetical protein